MLQESSLSHLLFLRHPDGWWWWAEGPAERAVDAPKGRDAFFLPDFFLADPEPWWIPERVEKLSSAEVSERLEDRSAKQPESRRQWVEPEREVFAENFSAIMSRIQRGTLEKAVAVAESSSEGSATIFEKRNWLERALQTPSKWIAYGGWSEHEGVLGLTPEILFIKEDGFLATMALAGTARQESPSLLESAKDRHEHDLVVQDILTALSPFGRPQVTPLKEWPLGALKHLRTDIGIKCDADFCEAVTSLHPTAALGCRPRSKLEDLRPHLNPSRGRFGAPFGLRLKNGEGLCVVAIRGVQWDDQRLKQSSGCGLVLGSDFEQEWQELHLKRMVVRNQLSL